MNSTPLFSQHSFTTKTDTINNRVKASVASLRAADFANSGQEALATTIYQNNALAGPFVDTEAITQAAPLELPVEVTNADAPNTPTLVPGRRFTFKVPFVGNEDWLQTVIPDAPENLPFGSVKDGNIFFSLQQPIDEAVEDLVTVYESNIAAIVACINALNDEIASFNTDLSLQINTLLTQRQAQINKNYTDALAFGVPIA